MHVSQPQSSADPIPKLSDSLGQDDFELHFSTESDCLAYLERVRWPNGFFCPVCTHAKSWRISNGLHLCQKCRHQTSITAGTIFEGTHKSLSKWFRALWLFVGQEKGLSAVALQRALALGSYHTAWTWMHKFRHLMADHGNQKLSGIIEVDEIYIGKDHAECGRSGCTPALVLVCSSEETPRKIKFIRMRRIANGEAGTLESAMKPLIELKSTVRTDGWNGYHGLEAVGFTHLIVRREGHLGSQPLLFADHISTTFNEWLLATHQGAVHQSHLDYYIDEFAFRYNCRHLKSVKERFQLLMLKALSTSPISESKLHGNNAGRKRCLPS